jgi:hypothetical protein
MTHGSEMTFGEFFVFGGLSLRDVNDSKNPVNLVRRKEPILGEQGRSTWRPVARLQLLVLISRRTQNHTGYRQRPWAIHSLSFSIFDFCHVHEVTFQACFPSFD